MTPESLRKTVVGLNSLEGKQGNQIYRLAGGRRGMVPILKEEDLKSGDEVLVPFLFEGEFAHMVVKEENGRLIAEDKTYRSYLNYEGSWTCEKCITKLMVSHINSTD